MADHKRWVKIWTNILDHPRIASLPAEDFKRWVWIMSATAAYGTGGTLRGPESWFRRFLFLPDGEPIPDAIERLPGMTVTRDGATDEHMAHNNGQMGGVWRDGDYTVTVKHWHRYQEDTTAAARMAALRAKKRIEEKTPQTPRKPRKFSLAPKPEPPPAEPPHGGSPGPVACANGGAGYGEAMREEVNRIGRRLGFDVPPMDGR
jgi:hypothetical protein